MMMEIAKAALKSTETPSSFNPDKMLDSNKELTKNFNEAGNKKSFNPDKMLESNEKNYIKCRNEDLAGQEHPQTGVPFKEKTVTDENGNEVKGVFPEFKSVFDAQLPDELEQASDSEQFKECNKQLQEAIENDPELASKFTDEQLEQVKNGDTPDGYTWHHNEEKGKMQLVDSEIHAKTGHTGGKAIWGGGSENR
ncbi:HNH endonuclease [Campylobacter devanensis]|uniref:HNH endonuclease n=1 Tax=Campylobacter devanensis TaxID=3161138 RepID=UPI000A344B2C|nr:HNH endonuclease [Campylobacter sp. P0209]